LKSWKFIAQSLFLMIFHLAGYSCLSQNSKSYSNQQWFQYYNQLVISNKYTLFTDAGFRTADNISRFSQWLVRASLGYPITKKLNGASGIAFFYHIGKGSNNVLEFRPFQELNTEHSLWLSTIHHRFRTEARIYRQNGSVINRLQQQFDLRTRYRLLCNIPLLSIKTQKISINVGNEFFYSFRLVPHKTPMLGNRMLLGVAGKTSKNITWSFTYNAQWNKMVNPDLIEKTDVVWIALTRRIARVTNSRGLRTIN